MSENLFSQAVPAPGRSDRSVPTNRELQAHEALWLREDTEFKSIAEAVPALASGCPEGTLIGGIA